MPEFTGSIRRSLFKARLVAREVSALSPATMRAIVTNSARMQRQDRRDRNLERTGAVAVSAGTYLSGTTLERDGRVVGISAIFQRATVEVECFANEVVRISWGPDDEPVPWATEPAFDLPTIGAIDVTMNEGSIVARTPSLRIEAASDGIKIFDNDAALRYHELAPLRRGAARVHRRILRPGETVYGFGEQAGSSNRSGRQVRFWNRDPGGSWGQSQGELYCSIPVSLARHRAGSALVFHENSFDATASVDTPSDGLGQVEIRFAGGMMRTWVAIGDDATVVRRYHGLTGKIPMPPRWALGYHHSRWGFRTDSEVSAVLDGFTERGIPISAIHLDIDYLDGYRVFSIDEERFGAVEKLSDHAATGGTRLVAIVNPGIRRDPEFDLYEAARAGNHLVHNEDGTICEGTVWPGWAVFPDFTRAATRTWWSGLYPRILDRGITGIWHDMNEPTSITLNGDRTLPRSARHDNNGRGGDHREVHNAYGMLMNRAGREGMRARHPERRPFIVSRAGWAGMQRHAWNWTADVESTMKGLTQQVATFLGLSLSGVSMVGSDIGGFSGVPSPELFLRWMELGVVSPFFRVHSVLGAPAREPWLWPAPYGEQVATLIAFRYRILPYLYSVIEAMARDGSPFFRPLWWGNPAADTPAGSFDDALLVGPDVLFALSPLQDKAERSLHLPEGSWWRWALIPGVSGVNSDLAERFHGDATYEFSCPLGQPLLFVRGGSIIPLDDAWAYPSRPAAGLQGDHAPQRLAFHVFPDEQGAARGSHYDDDGDGDGPARRDNLIFDDDVLTWTSEGDRIRPATIEVVIHGRVLHGAIADGTAVPPGALTTDGAATTIRVDAFKRLKLS